MIRRQRLVTDLVSSIGLYPDRDFLSMLLEEIPVVVSSLWERGR